MWHIPKNQLIPTQDSINLTLAQQEAIGEKETKLAEATIIKLLAQIYRDLQMCMPVAALNNLIAMRRLAKNITHPKYVQYPNILYIEIYTEAFKDVEKIAEDFRIRVNSKPRLDTIRIINAAVERASFVSNKILLPRHFERLFRNIFHALQLNWHKFDSRPEAEVNKFYDTLINMIAIELRLTSLGQRVANLTKAEVYIDANRSKVISDDLCATINNYNDYSCLTPAKLLIFRSLLDSASLANANQPRQSLR